MQAMMETIFDVCYLIGVVALGIHMLRKANGRKLFTLFGAMAVTLGCGDAFHLVPRVLQYWTAGDLTVALGVGKLITSVTMTVFYVLLYYIWRERYAVEGRRGLTVAVYALAIVRVALCCFPQNGWTLPVEPLDWGVYRNIPFALLGLLMIVLFYRKAKQDKAFRWMWLAVTLSFAFYAPVVLLAQSVPVIGALMIPKTCAYVWVVLMGVSALKQADRAL